MQVPAVTLAHPWNCVTPCEGHNMGVTCSTPYDRHPPILRHKSSPSKGQMVGRMHLGRHGLFLADSVTPRGPSVKIAGARTIVSVELADVPLWGCLSTRLAVWEYFVENSLQ